MKDLIEKIDAGDFQFKEIWRPKENSLVIIVPIVANKKTSRDYVVLEEIKDRVKIVDTGGIYNGRIEGDADKPTFIRGGTVLKGTTQERAIQFGVVVIPSKGEKIPVFCVHASRGIRAGTHFEVGKFAPRRVYSAMLRDRNQESTWHATETFTSHASQVIPQQSRMFARDDLSSAIDALNRFDDNLKDLLKHIPDYAGQVGSVILDNEGVLGFEIYDHPDSWKAFSDSIMRTYSDALAKEDKTGIFKANLEAVIPVVRTFLKQIEEAKGECVVNQNNASTYLLKTKEYVGEYTVLNGKTIHIMITRSDTNDVFTSVKRLANMRDSLTSFEFYNKPVLEREESNVLSHLEEQPQTWTYLLSRAKVSKATLSSKLKKLLSLGALEKSKGENGVTRYAATGIGQQFSRASHHEQQARLFRNGFEPVLKSSDSESERLEISHSDHKRKKRKSRARTASEGRKQV